MNCKLLMKKIVFVLGLLIMFNCAGLNVSAEPWIQTDDLFKVKIGMSSKEVITELGEPLFYENVMDEDDEITTSRYIYNFRTKNYPEGSDKPNEAPKASMGGRTTNIQFTFINDSLIGWEEDKLTLSMATNNKPKSRGGTLQLIGLLLNLIIIIKVF